MTILLSTGRERKTQGTEPGCTCGGTRRTVTDFALNPCRRVTGELGSRAGDAVAGRDGATIQFQVEMAGLRVVDARYRSSTCVTLIAYAEALAEQVAGKDARDALAVAPEAIVRLLPGVPLQRQGRAVLVARAWWSALARALESLEKDGLP